MVSPKQSHERTELGMFSVPAGLDMSPAVAGKVIESESDIIKTLVEGYFICK